jgi:peptidoglycan/LPS O-acetylase OafA/YrhL
MANEVKALTSLRFVAALWVFIFHIDLRWPLSLPAPLEAIVKQGAVGMSVFFILSGFVMTYSHADGIRSVRGYAMRRFARIYPLYALSALVTLPYLAPTVDGWKGIGQIAFVVGAQVLMIQAWFPPLFEFWNIGASWSLSAEAFFYAMFPLAMPLLRRVPVLAVLAISYVLSALPGLSFLLFPHSPLIYYSMPIFRFPEFMVGVCCATLVNRGATLRWPSLTTGAAAAVLAIYLGWFAPLAGIWVSGNIVAVPCIALCLVGAAMGGCRPLKAPLLVMMGHASYAFYSMQPLLILWMIAHQRGAPPWNPWLVFGASFTLLAAIAVAVHFLLEEPCRKLLIKRWRDRPGRETILPRPALSS